MDENESLIQKNLTALHQLMTAIHLLDQVNNTDTDFTNSLLPDCTEDFLMQLGYKMDSIALKIGAA